jgi:hypothetical protein
MMWRMTRRLRVLLAAGVLLLLCGGAAVAAGHFDSEQALRNFLFGPKLVRAEIVVRDAQGLHDYRIDRGRVLRVRPGTIMLRERDGTSVAVPLAPNVRVRLDGGIVPLSSVVRGMVATTVRDGEGAATQLLARER